MYFSYRKTFTDPKNFLVFLIGLFSLVKLRLLGTFGISELLCFALLPFVFSKSQLFKSKHAKTFFWMLFIWLIGVFFADFYNNTSLDNALKGSFNVIFLILLTPVVYWCLKDNPHRVLCFWFGNCISALIGYFFQKVPELNEYDAEVWAVYAYYPLFVFLSGAMFYKKEKLIAYLIIEGFAIWTLWHMSRNVFLNMTLAVVVLLMFNSLTEGNKFEKIKKLKKKSILLISLIFIAIFGVKYTYEHLASDKVLGEGAYYKYKMQKESELGLISGRGDFLESVYLVSRNPIWGYGSYAREELSVFSKVKNNFEKRSKKDRQEMLSGHSYLMGAWVYSGILGAVFWFYVLWLIMKFFRGPLLYDTKLLGLNVLLIFLMLWNILFSPFADRLNFLFFILLLIIQFDNYENAITLRQNISSHSDV